MELKPKVFLSHSKKDIDFIKKLRNDLMDCRIDTWFDEIDISHGESWLNAIFNEGIKGSDIILVYITRDSLTSKMVTKELDASLINELEGKNIKLLLYANEEGLRSDLRADLKTLQIPILNEENRTTIFPRIISEIWSHYAKNKLEKDLSEEKILKNNAELKLENYILKNNKSIFSENENNEFKYIEEKLREKLNIEITTILFKNKEKTKYEKRIYEVAKVQFLINIYEKKVSVINDYFLRSVIEDEIMIELKQETPYTAYNFEIDILNMQDPLADWQKYGLLKREVNSDKRVIDGANPRSRMLLSLPNFHEILYLSEKCDRFVYWLEYGKVRDNDKIKLLDTQHI